MEGETALAEIGNAALQNEVKGLMQLRDTLRRDEDRLKKMKTEVQARVVQIFEELGVGKIDGGELGTYAATAGRVTRKVDTDKLKLSLLGAGIEAKKVTELISNATTVSTGEPSARYTPWKPKKG